MKSLELQVGHRPPPHPDESFTLINNQQLVREIESQAIAAQQQIGLVRTQVASKQREMRLAQLTRSEMAALPSETAVYEGVGKMCVSSVPALRAPLRAREAVSQAGRPGD